MQCPDLMIKEILSSRGFHISRELQKHCLEMALQQKQRVIETPKIQKTQRRKEKVPYQVQL